MPFVFCPLFSGSSGNALYLAAGDTRLLIDAGVPVKHILASLSALGVAPPNAPEVPAENDYFATGVALLTNVSNGL